MNILYDEKSRLFCLHTEQTTYACALNADNRLVHMYWGQLLEKPGELTDLSETLSVKANGDSSFHVLANTAYEYRAQEPYHYDEPSLQVSFSDHVRGARLIYDSYRMIDGGRTQTLVITLKDEYYPLYTDLYYTLYKGLDVISRHSVIRNGGETPVTLTKMQSATLHFPRAVPYRLTHMAGSWGAEYQRQQTMLGQCAVTIENHRGTSSGPQAVPYFALDPRGEATETAGEVYYGVLHWSGNFKITVSRNNLSEVSVTGGINDFDTVWNLRPGESFETPDFTVGYSAAGFEKMSETLYDLQYDFLCPRSKAYQSRPVIYNSWYPYDFNVCEENMLSLIDKAADIGAELFVIDDGWFKGRTSDKAGLGDWQACEKRFPHGLEPISRAAHALGMKFGLWVEPEMVNPDSDLYREHPDWVLHDPTRPRTESRNQLVLNFARDDVRDFAVRFLDNLIETCRLDCLKWDMNRYMTETGWPDAPLEIQQSLSVRYIQNLYFIWNHLNEKYPHVLYENCAHGGARADFGMIPYSDRVNRSDNSRPKDVMLLHEGFTSLFIPKTAGGAGNISGDAGVPLPFRIHMGMTGSMSVGINLLKSSAAELEELKRAIAFFKTIRDDLQDAYVYRIASAYDGPYCVFQYVNRARTAFTVFGFCYGTHYETFLPRLKLRGVKPHTVYVDGTGRALSGDSLMKAGLQLPLHKDYDSVMMTFQEIANEM